MIMNHVSVSRLQLFSECSLKYKYKYHDKIAPSDEEPYHFLYGKFVHRVAEVYCQQTDEDRQPIVSVALKLHADEAEWKKLKRDDFERLLGNFRAIVELDDHLRASIRNVSAQLFEHKFALPFVTGRHHDASEDETKNAVGFIDRIIAHDDGVAIVDYKTTKKSYQKTIRQAAGDPQLALYSVVASKEFGVPIDRVTSMLYYVEGRNRVPAVFQANVAAQIIADMRETARTIMAMDPAEAKPTQGNHCRFCEYKSMCPAFNSEKGLPLSSRP